MSLGLKLLYRLYVKETKKDSPVYSNKSKDLKQWTYKGFNLHYNTKGIGMNHGLNYPARGPWGKSPSNDIHIELICNSYSFLKERCSTINIIRYTIYIWLNTTEITFSRPF